MKKTTLVFTLSLCAMTAVSQAAIFSDDFESGTLNKWAIEVSEIDGRGSAAEVVSRHGSQMGHLFKDGHSYTQIAKTLDYQDDLLFSFDMETSLYSEAVEPDSAWHASGGVLFFFLDNNLDELGKVFYRASTSTHIHESWTDYPENHTVFIEEGYDSHVYNIQDVLSNIVVNEIDIAHVTMAFRARNSGNLYNMNAHTWVDNVIVTPEPATLALLGLGVAALRQGKQKCKS